MDSGYPQKFLQEKKEFQSFETSYSKLFCLDTGGPVLVTVNIYMRSISKIDDVNMEYSAQFTFREEWVDPRLAYANLTKDSRVTYPPFVVLASGQEIWMPDTFFQNEKEARKHMIDKPNVMIRIYPDGKILYSVRLSLVLSCPMSLEYYPLDKQSCLIEMAMLVHGHTLVIDAQNSCRYCVCVHDCFPSRFCIYDAYTTADIKYEWKRDIPVQRKAGLESSLPSFELQDITTGYCTSKTATGEYSCLRTSLILRREFSYYLLQLYIPSSMLVIVSWVSFWLDKDSVPARVTLGVTTLLTMTTQSSGINAKLPPVSYTKAIDVWIGVCATLHFVDAVCLAFIFGALLEFALVNYAARRDLIESTFSTNRKRFVGLTNPSAPEETSTSMSTLGLPSYPKYRSIYPVDHHSSASSWRNGDSAAAAAANKRLLDADARTPCCLDDRIVVMNDHRSTTTPFLRKKWTFWDLMWFMKYKERSKRIDAVSRGVFPIGFIVFNFIYWTVYMI
uniref:Uncharacterized protein n=1 Tax=Romanomermis culicivorax TaxID=13658 RepID=A0A915ICK4_ROMCU